MEMPGEGLRLEINGNRLTAQAPRRLRPVRDARDLRRRNTLALGLGAGAVASVIGIVSALWLSSGPAEAPALAAAEAQLVGNVTVITTLQAETLMSDSEILRGPAPVGLNGRTVTVAADPVRREDALGPTRLAMASAQEQGEVRDAGQDAARTDPPAALVLAQSNLGWMRIFAAEGLSYDPVTHAPREAWETGACASRSLPDQGPVYCPLDRVVYLDADEPADPLAVLAIAHEVGRHVRDLLGVRLMPLNGDARDRQADCFAGMWAAGATGLADLAPGMMTRAMAGTHGLTRWQRERLAAFTRGYTARMIDDCAAADAAAFAPAD